jgi:hypothetical protein
MAVIVDNASVAGGLAVRPASKAARVELFDALGNKVTRPHGDANLATDEGLIIAGINDGNIRHLRTDRLGSIATSTPTVLLTEQFEGGTLPTHRWAATATTFAASQSASLGLTINSTAVVTGSTGYLFRSLRSFPRLQRSPLQFRTRARAVFATNAVIELGFSDVNSVTGVIQNGAYFQYTTGGVLQCNLTFNGVDISSAPITGLSTLNFYLWDIIVDDDSVLFTIQDTSTGLIVAERVLQLPATQPKYWAVTRMFAIFRCYVSPTAAATAPTLTVSQVDVLQLDTATGKTWREQASASGYGGGLSPVTLAQTANWTNSLAPTNAALSNTAAGYTAKDGLFSFAAVAGAATDYALFGFQAPSPYSFVCTGVDIETFNTGANVATTPTLLMWGLAHDLSNVALTTAGARVPVGVQDIPIGAIPGARSNSISKEFSVPLITNPGRFLVVMLRMPISTATASQVIQGMVSLRGYFD